MGGIDGEKIDKQASLAHYYSLPFVDFVGSVFHFIYFCLHSSHRIHTPIFLTLLGMDMVEDSRINITEH